MRTPNITMENREKFTCSCKRKYLTYLATELCTARNHVSLVDRPITPSQKKWIDEASYEEMVRKLIADKHNTDPLLKGQCGVYYLNQMNEKSLKTMRERAAKATVINAGL